MDYAGSYPWLILRQIRECVTWALCSSELITIFSSSLSMSLSGHAVVLSKMFSMVASNELQINIQQN